MKKLTLECWSRKRERELGVLLASLHNQTFQDWDLTLLEEADCNYLGDRIIVGLLRRLKNQGHNILFLHPKEILGCARSAIIVMRETKTPYAMKVDDDHLFEPNVLERMVRILDENDDVGVVGGMLYPIDRELFFIEKIPSDFNRWTGKKKRIWNDYSTLTFKFPEQVVEVDFVRAPFMYRADLLREIGFLEYYPKLGYSPMAHRLETEICNALKKEYGLKTVIDTGSVMWHFLSPEGGCRMIPPETRVHDDEIYYRRWKEFHR